MANQAALVDRRRHTLTGSVSQTPFAFYFAPKPQMSRGSFVGSKSCSRDIKINPMPRPNNAGCSGGTPSSHRVSTERPDTIQSEAMVEVKGHGNNVLKKKRRTSRTSSAQVHEPCIPKVSAFHTMMMSPRPGTSPSTSNWTHRSAADTRLPAPVSRSISSSGAISSSTTTGNSPPHLKQKSLWLNRKASHLPESKPFPTPPPPPKILMKHSLSSLSLEASLTSSSTATLTILSSNSKAASSTTATTKTKIKRTRQTSPAPSRFTLSSSSSSIARSGADNTVALKVPSHHNLTHHRGRTASIATSASMYSQQSYPHHLQLPGEDDDNRLGTKDWFLVEDQDGRSSPGYSFLQEEKSEKHEAEREIKTHGKERSNVASGSVATGSISSSRNENRSQRRSRAHSRKRTPSRPRGASSKSISSNSNSNSNSRCTSPSCAAPAPQSQYLEVPHRCPRKHRHRRKRSTDTAFTTGTFATTSTATTTSTTSAWRNDIAQVKEGMMSFLDMSFSGPGVELGSADFRDQESQWFELEVLSESESCLTPGSSAMTERTMMPLTIKSKKSRSKPNSTTPKSSWKGPSPSYAHSHSSSASNHDVPTPTHSAFLGSSISDRYSNVLPRSPSPSPVPSLSYVVFENQSEERHARYPQNVLPLPSPSTPTPSSYSYLPSPSLPPYSPNEEPSKSWDHGFINTVDDHQAQLDGLQLDYDYSFAVDVLVHVPEALVDPSFRGHASNLAQKGHARKASVSASIRVNLRPEEKASLTKSGTIRRSNSNKVKAKNGKGPKLPSRSKWSFGGGNKVAATKIAPALDEVVGSTSPVVGRGLGSVLKKENQKEKKKSLVMQVTNFFSRV